MDEPASPRVLLATPSYNEEYTLPYVRSLFALQKHLHEEKIGIELGFISVAMPFIEMARDYLATLFLENKKFTHLLFVDSDQGYSPQLIVDMVRFDKPVVGVVYPARSFDFDAAWDKARQAASVEQVRNSAVRFVRPPFVAGEDNRVEVVDGFARVSKLGGGILLIKREVLDRMAAIPELVGQGYQELIDAGYSGRMLQCFRPIIQPTNLPISEDVSFCLRWTELCGGEIWANIVHETSHVGRYEFKGKFVDRLRKS